MCNVKAKMAGGKMHLKYSLKHTAPQPDKQALQAKRFVTAIVTLDGITHAIVMLQKINPPCNIGTHVVSNLPCSTGRVDIMQGIEKTTHVNTIWADTSRGI